MAINKQQKQEITADVKNIVTNAKTVVFANFHGLTMPDITTVRKELRGAGVGYKVAKKTLAKRALAEAKFEGELPPLEGELVLAYSDDLIAPAREVYSFQKKLENKLSILGGIFEGRYMSKEEMMNIATIPSLKTLHAQVVNLFNSPIQGVVMALSEIAKKKS